MILGKGFGVVALWAMMSTSAYCQSGKMNAEGKSGAEIVLENDYVRYVIGTDGRDLNFVDKQTGTDYCAKKPGHNFARLKKAGKSHVPSAVSYAQGRITLEFGDAGVTAVIKVTAKKHYFVFEVESINDPDVDELSFANLAVTPAKYVGGMACVAYDDEFAACARALNLQTLTRVGGRPPVFSSRCFRKYGLVGAKVAVAGCPSTELRPVLKDVIRNEGLPYSPLGGPFALDAPENRGSYMWGYRMTAETIDKWIAMAKKAGFTHLHFERWYKSCGSYPINEKNFPGGLAGLKAVVDKIHAAGLKAGMHTFTGSISRNDPFVTPVPDKGLATDGEFTLASAIDEKVQTLVTVDDPGDLDTVWGYSSRGNVLRIDDELISYSGLSHKPPYGFTHCKRGACGTRVAFHKKGAAVYHLYTAYHEFRPDENSPLLGKVADAIADVCNTCGFDMVYLDGAGGMPGGWHANAKMSAAIFKRIKRPVLIETARWGAEDWPFHSRVGALDWPFWGVKRFIDARLHYVERHRKTYLLPSQLGWWSIHWPNYFMDAATPDGLEYLCCKALAWDAPISFVELTLNRLGRQHEYMTMVGRYERLRLAGYFSQAVKERLKKRRADFHLAQAPDGSWQFLPTDYAVHKVTGLNNGTNAWTVSNRFAAQPVRLRIKALYAAAPYDAPGGIVLADFGKSDEFAKGAAAKGVTRELIPSGEHVKIGGTSGRYSARNAGQSRRGAWTRATKVFTPLLDLSKHEALGVWVHGDGKGEILNFQLNTPRQYGPGCDEHYVKIDFEGWRYFELIRRERDCAQHGDHVWPYGGGYSYAVFRTPLTGKNIGTLNLYLNNLPAREEVTCFLSPIKALPAKKVKLREPTVTVGGKTIVFPVEMQSGWYVEFNSFSDCKLYDHYAKLIREVKPQGETPTLTAGENEVKFTCGGPAGYSLRAEVTVTSSGAPLRE